MGHYKGKQDNTSKFLRHLSHYTCERETYGNDQIVLEVASTLYLSILVLDEYPFAGASKQGSTSSCSQKDSQFRAKSCLSWIWFNRKILLTTNAYLYNELILGP